MDIDIQEKLELYWTALTDPYLAIRGGPCRPEHKIAGGARSPKKFSRPFGPPLGLKTRGGGVVALPGSSPESTPEHY